MAFFPSKAGARWLITLIMASTLCSVIYLYHDDANTMFLQHLLANIQPDHLNTPDPVNPPSPPGVVPPPPPPNTHHTRRPAWIDTPPAFDTTNLKPVYTPQPSQTDRPLALHPLLSAAMARFLARPALTHAQARPQNEAACPRAQLDKQVNADQLRDEQDGWVGVGAARIVEMRMGALEYLEGRSVAEGEDALVGPGRTATAVVGGRGGSGSDVERVQQGVDVGRGSRGVVLAAGNRRTVERAVMCVKELKRLGWTGGGIEVFHFEGEMTDGRQRGELEELGVTIRMVC